MWLYVAIFRNVNPTYCYGSVEGQGSNKDLVLTFSIVLYRGADMSLARPVGEQATATEDFDVHISYL